MNIDKAKHLIGGLYDISLNCICEDIVYHPIRIIEASKSIIGINPDQPEIKLLDYCERYVSSFKHDEKDIDFTNLTMPSVVTFLDLELSILDKNKKKTFNNLYYLSRVSDGTQILEFLLEFSLQYCSNSYLLVWGVYRMHLFLSFENVLKSLIVCVESILRDVDVKRDCADLDIDDCLKKYVFKEGTFKSFCSLYRIGKDDFVRSTKIRPLVLSVIKESFSFLDTNDDMVLHKDQKESGRSWILKHLSKINMKSIDYELILNLDAARGVLKIIDNENIELVWGRLNKVV